MAEFGSYRAEIARKPGLGRYIRARGTLGPAEVAHNTASIGKPWNLRPPRSAVAVRCYWRVYVPVRYVCARIFVVSAVRTCAADGVPLRFSRDDRAHRVNL